MVTFLTSSEQAESWMGGHHPETVVLATESVQACSLAQVPHSDALVFRVRQNELLPWVEQHARHVVVMASACINFPALLLIEILRYL